MFKHDGIYDYTSDFLVQCPSPDSIGIHPALAAPPLFLPHLAVLGDDDSLVVLRSEMGYSSSGCSSYGSPGPAASYGICNPSLIQRSISSQSVHKTGEVYSPLTDSHPTTGEWETLSITDMQVGNLAWRNQQSNSSLSDERSSIMESMNRACKYNIEEKKERIERYKTKKNLRNFNKKIKYECRKTLADRRPRIRGRFARNDEMEKTAQQWEYEHASIEEDEEGYDNWADFLDAFPQNV